MPKGQFDHKKAARKRRETLIKKLGSEAAYLAYQAEAGSKGGKRSKRVYGNSN